MIQLQVHLQLPCYDFCFLYWRNVGELPNRSRTSECPITCIAPSSETTTGGVYKWQGRNRHSLMSCAYETFLVARPIIAILGPKWVDVIPVIPPSFESSGSDQMVGILVLTDIVVRVSPRTLRSITDLLLPKISPCAKQGILQRRNPLEVTPSDRSQSRDCCLLDNPGSYWAAWISSVDGINQTNHSTDQKRPCTTIQGIEKEHSICQSSPCPDLVKFPVLSQIKPHAPRLVVPFRQFL